MKNDTSGQILTTGGNDIRLGQGSFEMQRMLRQNAHEKAFEIKVLAQRSFEKQRDKMVFEGRQKHKAEQDERLKQCELDLNIQRSQQILKAKLIKMKERNNCIEKIKEDMKVKLVQERTSNRARYLATVKNLILQAMIKLLEPSLIIRIREEDKSDIQKMLKDIEKEYKAFM